MKIEILEIAHKELEDAVIYHELIQVGLGQRFKNEVRNSIDRIKKHPTAWPIERKEVRKCFVHKFSYKIIYSIQGEIIVIIAVAHQHRRPEYWIDRVKDIP